MAMEYNMGSSENNFGNSGRVLREQPPRNLTPLTKLTVLFGGVMSQMGWAFFGFGMIFFWVFVMQSEARYLLSFDGEWVQTTGVLRGVAATNSEVNDRRIYAYHFSYAVGGRELEGVCYDIHNSAYQNTNSSVPVQYKSKNPKRARIMGMSTSAFPSFVLFVVIFPAIGLAFLIAGLLTNLKALKLLINGQFTTGKMVDKMPTGTRVNNQTVFKYVFEFEAGGIPHQAKCATYQTWKVEDEKMEIVLYDPQNPDTAVVFDAISGAPQIDPSGHFEPASAGAASILILPALSIIVNAIMFYIFVLA